MDEKQHCEQARILAKGEGWEDQAEKVRWSGAMKTWLFDLFVADEVEARTVVAEVDFDESWLNKFESAQTFLSGAPNGTTVIYPISISEDVRFIEEGTTGIIDVLEMSVQKTEVFLAGLSPEGEQLHRHDITPLPEFLDFLRSENRFRVDDSSEDEGATDIIHRRLEFWEAEARSELLGRIEPSPRGKSKGPSL